MKAHAQWIHPLVVYRVVAAINISAKEAAAQLTQVILEYSEHNSNPVLDLISGISAGEPYQINKKYPENRLRFGNDHWRAYYHSHSTPNNNESEHGHFHIFYRIANTGKTTNDWTHIAGLGMDTEGQPIGWFTVNNWVTGDAWVEASDLTAQLQFIFEKNILINRWLGSLVSLYRETIIELLESRDSFVNKEKGNTSLSKFLVDRDIYFLSSKKIDLLSGLRAALDQ